jgi:formylglycine-generating enzyme
MKKVRVLIVFVCVMAAVNFASADTIRGIDIDFVTIGNPGNAADTQVMSTDGTTGYGAVGYNYRIGKYEVTNAQWNTFTAAAGAPTGNDGGYSCPAQFIGAQQPTDGVSWYEATQFCNYLTSGDKSKGVYQFSGNNTNPGDFLGINRDAAISSYGIAYVIPTEDEWYKAAYFKPNGSGYSLYANGTSTAPSTSQARYGQSTYTGPWNVGSGTPEQNGTFDMMGNVWEWNEALFYGSIRGVRGGSYFNTDLKLASSARSSTYPFNEFGFVGFRVASVPEPASAAIMTLASLFIALKQRKR